MNLLDQGCPTFCSGGPHEMVMMDMEPYILVFSIFGPKPKRNKMQSLRVGNTFIFVRLHENIQTDINVGYVISGSP